MLREYCSTMSEKCFLRNILFRSHEKLENKEIAGYYIISSLMERYSTLLKLSEEKFSNLVKALEKPKAAKGVGCLNGEYSILCQRSTSDCTKKIKIHIVTIGFWNGSVVPIL